MPWILPGVPVVEESVVIALVSIIDGRGGKLESDYWEQASVLLQFGAIDVNSVPEGWREKGCKKLLTVGEEVARKLLDVDTVPSNGLILDW